MTGAAGHVEREARQLVDAAARWLSAVPDNAAYAERTGDLGADPGAGTGFGGGESRAGAAEAESGPHRAEATFDGTGASGEEQLCRGCPWCRAKAAAGPIGADTLDSIAHLLSAAAESLSLFAQSRREASQESGPEPDTADVEDALIEEAVTEDAVIDWDDEDEDELLAGADGEPQSAPVKERKAR